jgi:toxin-antitoxin system PIN domain toxin
VNSSNARYLLDLTALIALADPDHLHNGAIRDWFRVADPQDWAVCPLTEAGFVRVTTNPTYQGGAWTLEQATTVLSELAVRPGYRYWSISDGWAALTARFASRIFGHQQVTDAYLLGMAIKEDGVLVTFDRGIKYMAGEEFSRNVLIL